MKKTESNNLEGKTIITGKLTVNADRSSNVKNLKVDPEKTQVHRNSVTGLTQEETKKKYRDFQEKTQENKNEWIGDIDPNRPWEAEIVNKNEIMDEIIKNNDKFETIRVLMEILCKELGISPESQFGEIHKALVGITERYYKSMEDWKNLTKNVNK